MSENGEKSIMLIHVFGYLVFFILKCCTQVDSSWFDIIFDTDISIFIVLSEYFTL